MGRTPISIENFSGSPWPGMPPRSSCGSPTGTTRAASIAAVYQPASESRTASSSTASRPIRCRITGAGALPARNPGTRRSRPSRRAVWASLRSTSAAGTSACTRTRDSGSSVTVVTTSLAIGGPSLYKPGFVLAWLYTGPIGHLVAGIADWVALLLGTREI